MGMDFVPVAAELMNARILVVDDREEDLRLARVILESCGYADITCVSDPQAGFEMYQREPFDLLILDLIMPHMDGFQIMDSLRRANPGDYLPIIAVTADPELMERALAAGAGDFIGKPLSIAEVRARVRNVLQLGHVWGVLQDHERDLERTLLARTERLRESEELFRLFATHLPEGIWIRGVQDRTFHYLNPALRRVTGRDVHPGERIDRALEVLHPEDRSATYAAMERHPEGGIDIEARFLHGDGTFRVGHVRTFAIRRADGRPQWIGGIIEDITTRKATEQALREAESRFRALVEQSIAGIYTMEDGCISYANPRMCQMLGYALEELRTIPTLDLVVEEDRPRLVANRALAEAGDTGALAATYRIRRKEGGILHLGIDGRLIELEGRRVLFGIAHDVTEKMHSQELLVQAESHYRALVEQSLVGICIAMEGHIFYANPMMCELSAYTADELARKPIEDLLVREDLPVLDAIRERRRRGYMGSVAWSTRLLRKDGAIRNLSVESKIIELAGGKATLAMFQDVTERERAAAAHRESEEKYRLLWETATDVALLLSEDLRIQFANPAVREVLGYAPAEVEGKDIGCLFPPRQREAYRKVIARNLDTAVRTPNRRATEVTGLHRDRHTVPLEGAFSRIAIGGRSIYAVFMRDITQRKLGQVALEDANERLQVVSKRVLAVQEEERRGLSQELHDDVGQSLLALRMGLHRLEGHVEARQEGLLRECIDVSDAIQEKLRELSMRLVPPQLEQLGLQDALGWLARQQRSLTGLAIACRFAAAGRFTVETESACYRICQEALNNATRHALARQVDVELDADGESLILTIRDDGCGFDEPTQRAQALRNGSLGLIGMEERARLAGGRLEVRTAPGKGTSIFAFFPLAAAVQHESAERPARSA